MAGGFLAIGSFFSALSKNQVISFILAVVACGMLVYAGMPSTLDSLGFLPKGLLETIEQMSFQMHFDAINQGVLELKDLAFFILLIVGWIWANVIILDERKAA